MNTYRKDEVSVRVKNPLGNIVKPRLLGVILPDLNEWVLTYGCGGLGGAGEGNPHN